MRAEAVFNRVPYYSATKTTLFRVGREARPRAFESRLCPGRSDWFASLRAEIAHACELRRSEHARVVCSAGRSAVFNRVPYYSATKTTLFRVGRAARPCAFKSRFVPRPERLVWVVASVNHRCM